MSEEQVLNDLEKIKRSLPMMDNNNEVPLPEPAPLKQHSRSHEYLPLAARPQAVDKENRQPNLSQVILGIEKLTRTLPKEARPEYHRSPKLAAALEPCHTPELSRRRSLMCGTPGSLAGSLICVSPLTPADSASDENDFTELIDGIDFEDEQEKPETIPAKKIAVPALPPRGATSAAQQLHDRLNNFHAVSAAESVAVNVE